MTENSFDENSSNTNFQLGEWYVDVHSNELRNSTQSRKIESKVMEVLVFLASHPGELITRQQFEQEIWKNTVVGYDNLTACIAKLRKILQDDPRHPIYIETISKKGYRLIAPVSTWSPSAKQKAAPKFLWIAFIVCILSWAIFGLYQIPQTEADHSSPTIAVVPFVNLTQKNDYFSRGISADIETALSKIHGLYVISSSEHRKQRNYFEGVHYIVKGTLRKTKEKIRINVSLVDAKRNIFLWSEKYDEKLTNIFALQDKISNNIVEMLEIKLTDAEKKQQSKKYTDDFIAYDNFLRGRSHYILRTKENNSLAQEYYQQAIARDPNFARAYSALALTHMASFRLAWHENPNTQLELAIKYARQSIKLDKHLPHAHWALAYIQLFRQNFGDAMVSAKMAVNLNPNFSDGYVILAVCNIYFGNTDEALRLAKKAIFLNPKHPAPYDSVLGQAYFFERKYKNARDALSSALEKNNNLIIPRIYLIASLSNLNLIEDARWQADLLQSTNPSFSVAKIKSILPIQNPDSIQIISQQLKSVGL